MDLGLAGKACVVTGASRGIGRETARLLCAEGAHVLLVARSEERAARRGASVRRSGRPRRGARLRRDRARCGRAHARRGDGKRFGPVDVLVNNAGTAKWRDVDDVPDEDWQAAWELNVMACLRTMRALLPEMRKRGWGRVVNVSSTAGKRPSKYMPEYSVAKAALLSLSRLYADRCAADGVLVNAVCPGPTKSELWVGEGGLADQSAELSGLTGPRGGDRARRLPAGRSAGSPRSRRSPPRSSSCARSSASYVAGAAWSVDGGTVPVII